MKANELKAIDIVKSKLLTLPSIKNVMERKNQNNDYDLEVVLKHNTKFFVLIKSFKELYPRDIKRFADRKSMANKNVYLVVVSPYVSDAGHDLCKEYGIGYFDLSGNCLFSSDSIYISERGNLNKYKSNKNSNNIFNPKSLVSSHILRILMKNKDKTFKLKQLSEEATCSIGQVSKVKEALYNKNMAEFNDEGLQLTNIQGLMSEWAMEFAKREKNEVLCYTLNSLSDFEHSLQMMKEAHNIDYYLTGFSGGVRYAPVVRYNKVHVYIPSVKIKEAVEYLDCKEVSDGANIVIYPLEEDIYSYDNRNINNSSVVSPVQVYLDCMQIKGRGEEIAEEILRRVLIK